MPTLNPTTIDAARSKLAAARNAQQALVLVGPQGCGKSTLAEMLAAEYGTFVKAECWQITKKREVSALLQSEPRTVIVEDFNPLDPTVAIDGRLHFLKELITSHTIAIQAKGLPGKTVRTPNYIFCTGDAVPFSQETSNRRFSVVRMGAAS